MKNSEKFGRITRMIGTEGKECQFIYIVMPSGWEHVGEQGPVIISIDLSQYDTASYLFRTSNKKKKHEPLLLLGDAEDLGHDGYLLGYVFFSLEEAINNFKSRIEAYQKKSK